MRNSGDAITDRTGFFTDKDAAKNLPEVGSGYEFWLRKNGELGSVPQSAISNFSRQPEGEEILWFSASLVANFCETLTSKVW
jgi:hypothetical protein